MVYDEAFSSERTYLILTNLRQRVRARLPRDLWWLGLIAYNIGDLNTPKKAPLVPLIRLVCFIPDLSL